MTSDTEHEYWLRRWQENRTGWHKGTVMPFLEQHWPALGVPHGTRVLVPLCGKSLDMAWLAGQGLRVLGIELSPLAVTQFFAEHKLAPHIHPGTDGVHYTVGNIEIIQGDLFQVGASVLSSCTAVYDRAALIALPPAMRPHYTETVYGGLPAGSRGILITLEYPQAQMDGPPFSVDEAEVRHLLGSHWQIETLQRLDILDSQPRFQEDGVKALHTTVYRLKRTAD